MGKVVLGPSHTAGDDRKYHDPNCRYADSDPSPVQVMDEPDARVWGRPCRECFGDDGDSNA